MKLHVNLNENSYDIQIGKELLTKLNTLIPHHHRYCLISDSGVPKAYLKCIEAQFENLVVYVVEQGEGSKSIKTYEAILRFLLANKFSRHDAIIALGGGVVGDLAGFVAASYMRGIPYYQVPTTTLSQIDSSIGGKVAINLNDIKNVVGAFYQPKKVIIDLSTLETLPPRHFLNGLYEAIKAGLIYDPSLFELLEKGHYQEDLMDIIIKAIRVKMLIVEQDEKEMGMRKLLNFGHTFGHAIESYFNLSHYYHGECIAIGMLYFIENTELKQRLIKILEQNKLNYQPKIDQSVILDFINNDKKTDGDEIDVVIVEDLGKAKVERLLITDLKERL